MQVQRHMERFVVGFFDGACSRRECGCGAFIVIDPGKFFRVLVNNFQHIQFDHIYREQNMTADLLSKRGVAKEPGKFYFSAFEQNVLINEGSVNYS